MRREHALNCTDSTSDSKGDKLIASANLPVVDHTSPGSISTAV